MTIIYVIGNVDQIVQLSDRRLSGAGRVHSDEANKAALVLFSHARLALGYTGLARVGRFDVFGWLLKQLHDCAAPDYNVKATIERFVVRISDRFFGLSQLRRVKQMTRSLSMIFSGHIHDDNGSRPVFCTVSNSFDTKTGQPFDTTEEQFNVCFFEYTGTGQPLLLQRIGNWQGIVTRDEDALRDAVFRRLKASAIVDIGVNVIRSIAQRAESAGTIGRQVTSIVIPADPIAEVRSAYHTSLVKAETYMPDLVYLMPGRHMVLQNIQLSPMDANTPPLSVPRVKGRAPCPCGSKRRYRDCHGRPRRSVDQTGPEAHSISIRAVEKKDRLA